MENFRSVVAMIRDCRLEWRATFQHRPLHTWRCLRLFLVTVRNYCENQVDSLRLTSLKMLQCGQAASSLLDESFVSFKALVSLETPVTSSLLS